MEVVWYQKTWLIVLITILFLPAGIVLIAINKRWSIKLRIIWMIVSTGIYVCCILWKRTLD